jgi:hypothetical protein
MLIDERRVAGDESVHCLGLPSVAWKGTVIALPDSGLACKSVFTGRPLTFAESLDAGDAFADFPVAVFASPPE